MRGPNERYLMYAIYMWYAKPTFISIGYGNVADTGDTNTTLSISLVTDTSLILLLLLVFDIVVSDDDDDDNNDINDDCRSITFSSFLLFVFRVVDADLFTW